MATHTIYPTGGQAGLARTSGHETRRQVESRHVLSRRDGNALATSSKLAGDQPE